jgi:SAM-dependent methyltransferase
VPHRDPMRLRETFAEAAELYDRARPGYSAALFSDLAELACIGPGCRVLEIGCGTGQATLPLAERGCEIASNSTTCLGNRILEDGHPEPHSVVVAGRCQVLAIGTEREAIEGNCNRWLTPPRSPSPSAPSVMAVE